MDGAVVSSMVNVAVVSLLLPQSSVAVKVTVTAPVAPWLQVAQRGIAVAPGHGTAHAVVAGFGTAVVGEPIGEILGVAGSVTLDREVGGREVDGRIRVVR